MPTDPPDRDGSEPERIETVHGLLRQRAEREPEQIAINVAGMTTLSFGAWEERSNAAARALLDCGVRRGTRVALFFTGQDWVDYAVAYLGVLKAGGTGVHLAADLHHDEARRRWTETRAAVLVHGTDVAPPAGFEGRVRAVSQLDGDTTPVDTPVGADDLADILYTSGTTGPAKAYTNPHGTLTHGRRPAGLRRLDGSAPLLAPMPMGTPSSAMSASLMPLNSPSMVILCDPDDIEGMGALIARYRVATVLLTPWTGLRMVTSRLAERHDLSSVTTLALASAALPASTATALRAMMPGVAINTAYAQGEAVPAVILGSYDPARPMALGRPAPGTELRVARPDGEPVPDGGIGEIWLRARAARRRYLDEALNAELRQGDWIRTQDLGHVGGDGDLYLFDRMVDVIHTGERPVSSIEVEGALYDHPAVREAAVLGVPGPDGGERVEAVLVLDSPEQADDVLASLRQRLSAHQVPSAVHLVEALPRGVTGKVLKHRLRERLSIPPKDPTPKGRNPVMSQESTQFSLPVAHRQTSVALSELLHSGNSGVVVERVGQLRAEFRSEGRTFARELAEYINTKYVGIASVFLYEETFGTEDRLHWLIHLESFDAYEKLIAMGSQDEGWRDVIMRNRIPEERGGGSWERMFIDGSLQEVVLIPQSFGMYGTAEEKPDTVVAVEGANVERFVVPTAAHQSSQPDDEVLNSANCGLLMHRTGELNYAFRAEGRQFARALAEGWNKSLAGHATIYLYEEAFGLSDRIHWFIHLRSITDYYHLMGLRARVDSAARMLFTKQWIPDEKGGGGWERMFVQSTLQDMALTPQHWGMYATRTPK